MPSLIIFVGERMQTAYIGLVDCVLRIFDNPRAREICLKVLPTGVKAKGLREKIMRRIVFVDFFHILWIRRTKWKRIIFVLFLFFYLNQLSLLSIQRERWLSPSGVSIEVAYRTFQPGEIIAVFIESSQGIKEAWVQFLGRKYLMGEDKSRSRLLAFIGLDLGLNPGIYPVRIIIKDVNDQWETLEKEITVLAKKFPVRKLWVKEKYVIPPAEVRERIKRESEILKSIYSMFTPQWLGKDKFIVPVSGRKTADFGERRIYNNKPRSSHRGVDIASPLGAPVRASNSGRVVLASNLYFSGMTVIIDHGLGLFTLYCHFSKIRVKRGELVEKGDIIGEVGATGRATGPHLHWGVKVFGSGVDPFSLLSFNEE